MKKKNDRTRSIWFGLIGLAAGLAIGYLGGNLLGYRSLLGSSHTETIDTLDLETQTMLLQIERADEAAKQMEDLVKQYQEKKEAGENPQLDMTRLQGLMNNRAQAMQMASDLLIKQSTTMDSIMNQ